jgi:putative transposase
MGAHVRDRAAARAAPTDRERMTLSNRRRSLRLKEYDYAQAGAYFITICTHDRACLFGDVVDGSMRLNGAGQLAATLWNDMPLRRPNIDLDACVVMPNHIHGIVVLSDGAATVGGGPRGRPRQGQGDDEDRPYGR